MINAGSSTHECGFLRLEWPAMKEGLLHVRESWIKSWETIGRQKCGKVRDYDRERRCTQTVGKRSRGERVSEEGLY